jgi:hypothetical protein
MSRELSGLTCRELGRHFAGVCGAAITIRHRDITRRLNQDRQLAKAIRAIAKQNHQ